MADTSTCTAWRCGAVTEGLVATCPSCGGRTVGSRRIRVLGGVLVALGLCLVGLMGAITYHLHPTLTRPGIEISESGRWTGTAEQARMVLNLFWIIIGFGVLCAATGAWQLITGRRSRLIIVMILLGAAAIFLYGWETADSIEKSRELEAPHPFVPPPPITTGNFGASAPDKPQ